MISVKARGHQANIGWLLSSLFYTPSELQPEGFRL